VTIKDNLKEEKGYISLRESKNNSKNEFILLIFKHN
jgi:hypothetical protein